MTFTLKVLKIINETHEAKTICFKQPTFRKIIYRAGQYITIIVNVNGRKYRRPYSLSSTPGIDSTVNITVKRVLHGIVSNHLIDTTKEGDMLEVVEPMGNFIYDSCEYPDSEIFLWGAGSGISPLFSILNSILKKCSNKVFLIYCNSTKFNTIFYNQLNELKRDYHDRFRLSLFSTKETAVESTYGRLNEDHVFGIMEDAKAQSNALHYICGPIGFKENVLQGLQRLDVGQTFIFSEDFENVPSEKDLKGIKTRFVAIINKGVTSNVEVLRGKNILEAGLDQLIDLSYSCQTGSCCLCKARLLLGKVNTKGSHNLQQELEEDEILLCCSYPLTDNIKIEID